MVLVLPLADTPLDVVEAGVLDLAFVNGDDDEAGEEEEEEEEGVS